MNRYRVAITYDDELEAEDFHEALDAALHRLANCECSENLVVAVVDEVTGPSIIWTNENNRSDEA